MIFRISAGDSRTIPSECPGGRRNGFAVKALGIPGFGDILDGERETQGFAGSRARSTP